MLPTTPCRNPVLVMLSLSVVPSSPALGRDSLSLSANVPTVSVAPRNGGRNFLRLPELEYTFEVLASCTDGRHPTTVSLSVADSRKSLTREELDSGGPAKISLRIPPAQIAPLPVEDFCVVTAAEGEHSTDQPDTQLAVSAALSAQGSLLCESESDKAMTYVSKALDVLLMCLRPPPETDRGPERAAGEGDNP